MNGDYDKSSYDVKGYCIIDDVFPAETCAIYVKIAERHSTFDFAEVHNLERKSRVFKQIVESPLIVSIVKQLMNAKSISCIGSLFHFRRPNTRYADAQWLRHQDNAYARAPEGKMVTVHLALTDSEAENGGVWIAEGSHREGLLPHFIAVDYIPPFGFKPKRFIPRFCLKHNIWKTPIDLKIGSICIQHGNAIHGSYPNHTQRSREHFGIMYIETGVKFNRGFMLKRKAIPIQSNGQT